METTRYLLSLLHVDKNIGPEETIFLQHLVSQRREKSLTRYL